MADESTLVLTSRLVRHINGLLSALDIDLIGKETGRTIGLIKHLAADARLDVRDYEMSENRAEMTIHARTASKRLEDLRAQILRASENGIFGAIDVAVLSADLDAIVAELR